MAIVFLCQYCVIALKKHLNLREDHNLVSICSFFSYFCAVEAFIRMDDSDSV